MRPLALAAVIFSCAACQCGPQLSTIADDLVVEPNKLDFGTVDVGTQRTLNVTVKNQGLGAVTLHPFVAAGPFSAPLADLTLAAGGSQSLAVAFTPTAVGTFSSTLSFSSSLGVDLEGRAQGGAMSCVPKTCADLGRMCGSADDSCGHPLDCGGCVAGTVCDPEVGTCACAGSGHEDCGNGKDDDCDGLIDCADSDCAAVPACTPGDCTPGPEVRLTQGPRQASGPAVEWSGTELGVAWEISIGTGSPGALDFGFQRVDATGAPIGSAIDATTDGLMAHPPRLAWSGTDWVIASSTVTADLSKNMVQVRHLSAAGAVSGNVLTLGQGFPATVATDPVTGEVGVLWGDNASMDQPALTLVSSAQVVGNNNVMQSGGNWNDYGDLVWTGSGWGAVWTQVVNNVDGIYFSRLDAQGTPVGTPVQVDLGQGAYYPRIAWSGQHYAVVFSQGSDVFFRRYDAMGVAVGAAVQVSPQGGGAADIVWTGAVYAIVWSDARTAKPTVYVGELDDSGQSVGMPRQVSCGVGGSARPSVAFTGTQLAVVWDDQRNAEFDVYLKLVDP